MLKIYTITQKNNGLKDIVVASQLKTFVLKITFHKTPYTLE